MSAEEQERLRQAVRETEHKGLFTPSSHLRSHIQFPGAWGGANWGSVAADPETGMLFVRSLEMPSYRRMALSTERPGPPAIAGGQREQDGYGVYAQLCATCHGPGQVPMQAPFSRRCLELRPRRRGRSVSAQPAAGRCARG
jgi:quinoprotein glucose dehydrogenase